VRALFGFPFPLSAVYYEGDSGPGSGHEETVSPWGEKMLQSHFNPSLTPARISGSVRGSAPDRSGEKSLEARVKPDCVHLYPGVDPQTWYQVVQEGEYRDEMEGLWIQVNDWVTYVLAKHFDLQSRPPVH
jgi:hypothetical protein